MTVRNDDRFRVVHRPPPPPPKPKVDRTEDGDRREVDPAKQSDARQIFQRATVNAVREGGAAANGPEPKRGVKSGEERIELAMMRIEDAESDDARRDAILKASETVRDVMAQTKPEARPALLEKAAPQIEKLGKNLDKLSGDDTRTAIGNLTKAAESAGRDGVDKIAKSLAQATPGMIAGHEDNKGELLGAIGDSIKSGKGALLGAALGKHLEQSGSGALAAEVNDTVGGALDEVRSDFASKHEAALERDGQLGAVASQWQGTLSPQEMQAGVDRFKSEHGEYADREASAKTLASTLEGAAYAKREGTLGETANATLRSADDVAQTDAGARLIGEKLVEQGRGQHTFLEEMGAGRDQKSAAAFQQTIGRSIVATQSQALSTGERQGLTEALRGAASVTEGAMRKGFEKFAAESESSAGIPPEQFGLKIAGSGRSIANEVSKLSSPTDEGLSGAKSFQQLGAALSVAAVGVNAVGLTDGADAREVAGATVGAAGATTAIAGLAGVSSAQVAGKALFPVGLALSAFDTGAAIDRGDELGAVAAGAPLAFAAAGAGIGAATGSIAPVAGTAIGAAVGGAIGIGIGVGRKLLSDAPDETLEKETQSFLNGALEAKGLSPEDAERAALRLRDVDGQFYGIGAALPGLAERAGTTPGALLEKMARLPDEQLHELVKDAIHEVADNGEAVREAQEKAQKGEIAEADVPAYAMEPASLDAFFARWSHLLR